MKKQERFTRGAGVLLPVFSLPSQHGIGCFDEKAYEFIDFLQNAGQTYWQILPLTPVGYGNSPYQSSCAFAGNLCFINLKEIATTDELSLLPFGNEKHVDYSAVYKSKMSVLKKCIKRILSIEKNEYHTDYTEFCKSNTFWLNDFAFYMSIKEKEENAAWYEWKNVGLRDRNERAMVEFYLDNSENIEFWKYTQFLFYTQWKKIKKYANDRGISIIGDVPIYVSHDSSDVWANRALFVLDEKGHPTEVAGVPPDIFSSHGQLWGNPIYNWDTHEEKNFDWWKKRIEASSTLFDVIRIDHFIGIVNYYAIPATESTAKNGKWYEGPAEKLINVFSDIKNVKIIAEDLGNLTTEVEELMKKAGYPGMKILQFAFAGGYENPHLPHNFSENCVVYGGTHDNQTLVGYFSSCDKKEIEFVSEYLKTDKKSPTDISKEIIKVGLSSAADIAVFTIQDYLGLDDSARINVPSTSQGNWQWRINEACLADNLSSEIYSLCKLYNRINSDIKK